MHHEAYLGDTPLYSRATYVRALRAALPPEAFEPARARVALIPAHLAVIALASCAIALGWLPWPVVPIASIVIGISFSGIVFVAHEAMHGGVVRGKYTKHVLSWVCFLPFVLSPRLWAAWHDRVHHASANLPEDPDVYPSLAKYQASGRVRFFINTFALGGRRWRGGLSLILGFTVQSAHQLISAKQRGHLDARQHALAIGETLLGIAVWATVAWLVGGPAFLFVFVVPHLVANAIVMAFILTNHSLSPRVSINDPLVSGLSVTTPRWVDWLTLHFGYHVEHHVFPAMSSRHAPLVRALLRERWPERYQSMPLRQALGTLHRTARVYKDDTTLIDPRTGQEYPTLVPRMATALRAAA